MSDRELRTADEGSSNAVPCEENEPTPVEGKGLTSTDHPRHNGHSPAAVFSEWAPFLTEELRFDSGNFPEVTDHATTSSWSIERWAVKQLWHKIGLPHLSFLLWDGWEYTGEKNSSQHYRVVIRNRGVLWRLITSPNFFFMEGYTRGEIEVQGNLMHLLLDLNSHLRFVPPRVISTFFKNLRLRTQRQTLQGCRRNAAHHYNLGNDFYKLWLDQQLLYTCAYFPTAGMSLEAAQIAKMDHVCRKLGLKAGEQVVEAGCGWGALALHMASHYGVRVKAYNVSSEQVHYARQRASKEGLDTQVEFIQDDWRNISGTYDAFVSVGMLEHVGPEQYSRLGQIVQTCLSSQGRGLIHTIGQNLPQPLNPWIEQRIFPGAHPPTLAELVSICPAGQLTVLDVENLRLHYAETLRHWVTRFEQSLTTIRKTYDEDFIRMWRMYLVASCTAFATGGLQLYQMLFAPAHSNAIPRSRAYQYGHSVNGEPSLLNSNFVPQRCAHPEEN